MFLHRLIMNINSYQVIILRMNTRHRLNFALFFIIVALFLSSCAKEVVESSDSIEKRILESYISVVHKDTIQPLPSGVYIINSKKGTGASFKENSSAFVRYSTLDLKGNYLSTTNESIAKQLGSFSYANYYGPILLELDNYTLIKGLEEAFLTLKEGARAKIIIPSWASEFNYLNSDRYHATTTIYDVEIIKVIDDYPQYELDTLHRFSNIHYDGLDSLVKGYYYKSLVEGSGDSLKAGLTAKYNYVGRLTNGFVFDTNIEDTARKYRIYSADKTYGPLTQEIHEVGGSSTSGSSVVDGFAKTLLKMRYGGKAITFFGSEWGYASETQSFGKRQQLHFYIEVLPQ